MKYRFWKISGVVLTIFAAVVCLASCTPELKQYKGSYSFKTAGYVVVHENGTETGILGETTEINDTMVINLSNEAGQMNVVVSDKDARQMIITMNILGGGSVSFTALADKETLTLEPKLRYMTLNLSGSRNIRMPVEVSGTGSRYDNILLFDLKYEGSLAEDDITYTILESHVECVAEKNEF